MGARRADRSDWRILLQREQRAQRSSRVWAGAHPSGRNARVHRGGAAAAAVAHAVVVPSVPPLAGPMVTGQRITEELAANASEASVRLLEVSCRALFMRCADATIVHEDVVEWEPWMGEPPPVIHRRSADDLLEAFEQDLHDVRVLRLLDAEWLDNIEGAPPIHAPISAFRARGGVLGTDERTARAQGYSA